MFCKNKVKVDQFGLLIPSVQRGPVVESLVTEICSDRDEKG